VPRLRFPGFDGEWEAKTFSEIADGFDYGINAAAVEFNGKHKYIRITDIDDTSHKFIGNPCVSPSGEIEEKYKVQIGDILLARTGASVGKSYLYDVCDGELYFAGFLIRARVNPKYDPRFVFYITCTPTYARWVSLISMRSGQPGINAEEYSQYKLFIPEGKERTKIADFLSFLDSRIAAQRKLVELLKKHKRGVQSAIFEGYLRVPCQGRERLAKWETIKIGNIFNERSERGGNADELLSVTINFGVRRQSDTEKKDSSSEDKGNYKRVVAGDIVYNTMRMWQGASGVSPWAGIVSPAYTVIYPKRNQNTIFWAYAFKHWRLVQTFQKFSQGLTSDTWNLKFPQLADIKVAMPSLDEQNVIVEFLSRLDARIDVAERELVNLSALKSGLLQQLFV